MSCLYNDNDKFACAWLRELCGAGEIPKGVIDDRSIEHIDPREVPATAHFFAGIGGWAYALRLAGWPDDRPVWSGSCPCQPFSQIGRGGGASDPRHLWPAFRRLIAERLPSIIFGEQVAGTAGRLWLGGVRLDLESMGYAVGAADLCAAGIGSPHIRPRLYWVAARGMGNAIGAGLERHARHVNHGAGRAESNGPIAAPSRWRDWEWVPCADGKARPLQPGISPMVDGFPNRVGTVRGYGNAIVPQLAAEFIRAFMEIEAS